MPQSPDIKEMGRTTSQDEPCKHPKHPAEIDVRTLPDEIGKCKRDRVIRNPGDRVRNYMKPDQPRLPKKAKPVRCEPVLTESRCEKRHICLPVWLYDSGERLRFDGSD